MAFWNGEELYIVKLTSSRRLNFYLPHFKLEFL